MATSWLNQDFGGDDEESDNDFNPAQGGGSDDETAKLDDDSKSRTNDRRRREEPVDESEADGVSKQTRNHEHSRSRPSLSADSNGQNFDDEDDNGAEDMGEDNEREPEERDRNEVGDDEDEEDEEEADDEDEDDIQSSRPRKRRRRGGLNQFFEEEAEVDEEDDEVEDEEDLGPEFIQDTHPDDDLPAEADQDDRRHRELDRQRQMEQSMDAEKQAAALKERYGRRTTTGLNAGALVPQNLLMPSVDDPSIWGVKCKPGKEREIVAKINKKMIDTMGSRNAMRIFSAFERGGGSMAGYIFVEAKLRAHVENDLSNVADCYPRSRLNLVPVKEMPDLLRVTKNKELETGGYVRIKRGLYNGDLGMIEELESNGLEVTVRLVPRLDYGLNDEENARLSAAALGPDGKRKRPNLFAPVNNYANRPPQKLFSESEAKKRHSRFLAQLRGLTGNSWQYKGDRYEDGFLVKDFKLQHLVTENVNPRLDEITKLTRTDAEGAETLDLETLKHSIANASAEGTYVPGDDVEVYDGEQRGTVGKIEHVAGNIISIQVSEGELKGQIVEVPVKGVRKKFKEGDHVKVIGSSRYRDEVGMVIGIKDDKVTVLTDTSMQEITVFSKDLREAADSGGAAGQVTKFDVQDLIQLDATTTGVVIKADRESVQLLDQNGSVTTRLPSQIQKLETRKNAVATDKNGAEIRPGDVIRESGGESKTGTILHVQRGFVFAHNRTQLENAGLWVARCMNVITTAAKGGRITAPSTDMTRMNPALQMRNGNAGAGMAPPQRPGRDRLQGQSVQIRKGPYKGHRGLVKDTTATVARIELQSKNKIVNVEKQDLMVIDRNSGREIEFNAFMGSRGPPVMRTGGPPGSRVPESGFGGRTPIGVANGGRTPAWGSSARTPAWGGSSSALDSGRTPAWKGAAGSATSYGGAGNTTTYGGPGNHSTTGSRTPAWSSSAKTPYGAEHGFGSSGASGFDAFAAGSRTPAYSSNSSSRTPAWTGPSHAAAAPTPAASAPTPGFSGGDDVYTPYGAPTPGAAPLNAPTPGGGLSATTPYGGGYDAPTPAAGGPRYADDDDE